MYPWLLHFFLESSAFLAIVGIATAGLYNTAQLPGEIVFDITEIFSPFHCTLVGSVAIGGMVVFVILSSVILWSFAKVLRSSVEVKRTE